MHVAADKCSTRAQYRDRCCAAGEGKIQDGTGLMLPQYLHLLRMGQWFFDVAMIFSEWVDGFLM